MSLDKIHASISAKRDARWDPEFCGQIEMKIDAKGTWWYQGNPIGRDSLVSLFVSVLHVECGRYYLITPAEKIEITVEDVPFVVEDWEVTREGLNLVCRYGYSKMITSANEVELKAFDGVELPYFHLGNGLWAKPSRKVFYQMCESASLKQIGGKDALVLAINSELMTIGYVD